MSRYTNLTPYIQDSNGKPIVGAKTYFYEPGTVILKTVYSDSNFATPIANPVISLAGGILPTIFLNGLYKVAQHDENDVAIYPTEDPIGEISTSQFSDWVNDAFYSFNDIVRGSDLAFYKSLVAGIDTNQGNDPISSPAEWGSAEFITGDAPTITDPIINGSLTGTAIGRGALVYLSATQNITTNVTTIIPFGLEDHDTDTIHDNITDNSRLTVPAGVTKALIRAKVNWVDTLAITGLVSIDIRKNGTASYVGFGVTQFHSSATTASESPSMEVFTAPINVVAGDYFELNVFQSTGNTIDVVSGLGGTWFSMEIIK